MWEISGLSHDAEGYDRHAQGWCDGTVSTNKAEQEGLQMALPKAHIAHCRGLEQILQPFWKVEETQFFQCNRNELPSVIHSQAVQKPYPILDGTWLTSLRSPLWTDFVGSIFFFFVDERGELSNTAHKKILQLFQKRLRHQCSFMGHILALESFGDFLQSC